MRMHALYFGCRIPKKDTRVRGIQVPKWPKKKVRLGMWIIVLKCALCLFFFQVPRNDTVGSMRPLGSRNVCPSFWLTRRHYFISYRVCGLSHRMRIFLMQGHWFRILCGGSRFDRRLPHIHRAGFRLTIRIVCGIQQTKNLVSSPHQKRCVMSTIPWI